MHAISTALLLLLAGAETVSNPRLLRKGQLDLTTFAKDLQRQGCKNCTANLKLANLAEQLWNLTSDVRQRTLDSIIISGVRQINLDPAVFGKYNMQDGVWCEEASKSMQTAAEGIPYSTGRHVRGFLLQESLNYQRSADSAYREWGITNGESIQTDGACRSYFEYERMVAENMEYGYFIACMIPCAKLWPWLGNQLLSNQTNFGPYTSWVHNSLDPSYTGYEDLDSLLDMLYIAGLVNETVAYDVYRNCMEGELDFFNSSK